ncbi:hypothetical protein DFH09DRAFT_1098687 [Mycena vulgaris]|nr:hypothetical protein DFH09DRAFT_1098687 [Mycena vulgaris]
MFAAAEVCQMDPAFDGIIRGPVKTGQTRAVTVTTATGGNGRQRAAYKKESSNKLGPGAVSGILREKMIMLSLLFLLRFKGPKWPPKVSLRERTDEIRKYSTIISANHDRVQMKDHSLVPRARSAPSPDLPECSTSHPSFADGRSLVGHERVSVILNLGTGSRGDRCVPGDMGLLSSISEGPNGIKSGYFRHRDYIDLTLPTLLKMKFSKKASGLEFCTDVAPYTFQLVAMLFVAVAAAVPTEMLKREPGSSLESEARGIVHCNAICVPVDCCSSICGGLPILLQFLADWSFHKGIESESEIPQSAAKEEDLGFSFLFKPAGRGL